MVFTGLYDDRILRSNHDYRHNLHEADPLDATSDHVLTPIKWDHDTVEVRARWTAQEETCTDDVSWQSQSTHWILFSHRIASILLSQCSSGHLGWEHSCDLSALSAAL